MEHINPPIGARFEYRSVQAPGAILSIVALLWGFLPAPFLHIHSEEGDHPATSPVHVHVHTAAKASGPVIGVHTADEGAIDVEWTIAPPPPSAIAFTLDLATSGAIIIAAPPVVAVPLLIPQTRGHDPPDLTPKQPRSPPA